MDKLTLPDLAQVSDYYLKKRVYDGKKLNYLSLPFVGLFFVVAHFHSTFLICLLFFVVRMLKKILVYVLLPLRSSKSSSSSFFIV